MADVEMKAEDEKKAEEKPKDEEKDKKPAPPTPLQEIKTNIALIERAVSTLEPRFTHRVLRSLTSLRKRLDDKIMRSAIEETYTNGTRMPACRYLPYPDMHRSELARPRGVACMDPRRACRGAYYGSRPRSDPIEGAS